MTREKMLEILGNLPFMYIDPEGGWKDVGFTEREIWINSKGYGYVMCDETIATWECHDVDVDLCQEVKKKLLDETLTSDDIIGTIFSDLLDTVYWNDYNYDDSEELASDLAGLKNIDVFSDKYLGGICSDLELVFFTEQEAFNKAYERDWADVCWDELDDELLAEWLGRLAKLDIIKY